jgi:hypothetical protein
MRQLFGIVFVLLVCSNPSYALVVTQAAGFSTSTSTILADFLPVEPFDPSLGVLNRVDVSIDGVVNLNGFALGLQPWQVDIGIDVFGFGGKYFDFSGTGIDITYSGVEPYIDCSIGGCIPYYGPLTAPSTAFSMDFYFTDFAESIGLNQAFLTDFDFSPGPTVSGTPPAVISGAVSGFLDDILPINEIDVVTSLNVIGPVSGLSASIGGAMTISYDYTPHASSVPEPSTLALMGIGLAGIGFARRKRA